MNIGKKSIKFFDETREKNIQTNIYYPTSETENKTINLEYPMWECEKVILEAKIKESKNKYPLIILSHGNGGNNTNLTWIADSLVKKGYVCITFDHQEEIFDNEDLTHIEYWNRPQDVNYIMDSIQKINFFKENVDFNRVCMTGFSLGGLTTAWLMGATVKENIQIPKQDLTKSFEYEEGFDQDLLNKIETDKFQKNQKNNIFKCGIMLAPARGFPNSWGGYKRQKLIHGFEKTADENEGMIIDKEGLSKIEKPICIITGDVDEIVENETNAFYYNKHIKNSKLNVVKGDHYVFFNRYNERAKEYFDEYLYEKHQGKEEEIIKEQKIIIKQIEEFLEVNL